ncbi:hypothetical protein A2997_02570 [Candidatus Nomurabacteria bacterium RIFCSPLOWO2_01_FULL_36_10b]|uniref:SHS2 domain-containing protein n=1 Tax=Candidatus Nomurabacteria bacterium RIFCSPLOWO2_01_FULL_36_10b TaxID=1801766 RepID=A0A1F6WN62_9BACT|nr:MAG: hypothetical protein A2997_02570 [Candidatus Nomurabacteria bacterium RIFCSPLOWO2_01_FULL_36_10b]
MFDFFKKFVSGAKSAGLSNVFGGKHNSIVGVDIGSSSIKVVEMKKEHGKIVLTTYGEIALGPYQSKPVGSSGSLDPDITANALIDLLKEAHTTTRDAVVAIQSSASLIFMISLPASAEKKLDEVIPNEARKYIPVPLSEVTLNWIQIPAHITQSLQRSDDSFDKGKLESDRIQVLVVALRNDVVGSYKNVIAQASLSAHQYEIEMFSAVRSSIHNELSPVMIIDFGASQTRCVVVCYGMIFKYNAFNRGGTSITDNIARSISVSFEKAEELKRNEGLVGKNHPDVAHISQTMLSSLAIEIQTTMLDFQKEYNKAIDKIVMIGGGARMEGLSDYIQQTLGVPTSVGDPFGKTEHPEFLNQVLSNVGPEFSIAAGSALYQLE